MASKPKKKPSKPAPKAVKSKKPVAKTKAKSKPAPKTKVAPKKVKKPVAKKPAIKKPVAKKPVAKKPAPAKKAPATKSKIIKSNKPAAVVTKPSAKKSVPAKPVPAKPVANSKSAPVKAVAGKGKTVAPIPLPKPIRGVNVDDIPVIEMGKKPPLGAMFLKRQRQRLVELQSHLADIMEGVAKDSLRNRPEGSEASAGGMHMGDAGSDAYDRDFALSLLSKEQDALYEIQEALKRIDSRTYGYCEMTGHKINEERLEALPFARYTREAQEQIESNQRGGGYLRVPTRSVFNLNEDGESEDEEGEEEETTKLPPAESSLDFMKE